MRLLLLRVLFADGAIKDLLQDDRESGRLSQGADDGGLGSVLRRVS